MSFYDSWICPYLDRENKICTIYEQRPIECRLLQCWDTTKITAYIYHNLLTRWDLVNITSPIFSLLKQHDKECNYSGFFENTREISQERALSIQQKTVLDRDLFFRQQAIQKYDLSLAQELFYFGRPMFKVVKNDSR